MFCLLYVTHAAGGLIAGYLATGSLSCGAVAAAAALLPDVESSKSFVGRKLPGVSHAGSLVVGHRNATHSLLAALGVFLVGLLFSKTANFPVPFVWAAFIGYLSHLILDTFNPAGVPWFWPLKIRLRIPIVQTGGALERLIVFPALALLCVSFIVRALVPAILRAVSFAAGI
ncbi:MAG: metal-dependent hydrolase [Thermacetogeniaceae bacterium]